VHRQHDRRAPRPAQVQVVRGAVEVSDFRSGQQVVVLPGQSASVSSTGARGLRLNGPGAKNPIRQGTPRAPGAIKAQNGDGKGLRISAPLGEVKLDFNKVTSGLARGAAQGSNKDRNSPAAGATVWSSREFQTQAGTEARAGGNSGGAIVGAGSAGAGVVSGGGGGASAGSASTGGSTSSGGGGNGGLLSGVVSTATGTVNGVTSGAGGTVGGLLGGGGVGGVLNGLLH
jgi:hypothetical protein